MKIATYNIWDHEAGMPLRFQQIMDEITRVKADVFCLQEVADRARHDAIVARCGYEHAYYCEEYGLSIQSKVPMDATADFPYAAAARLSLQGRTVLVINVHLPWQSAMEREKAIVGIIERAGEMRADRTLLTGDFNSGVGSSVHRYLTNEQSLLGSAASFYDLAEAYAEMTETRPVATLDFRKNPRWGAAQPKNTIEVNMRCDWIMLKNPYPAEFPELKSCEVFGTAISPETHLAPSDHYGVAAELLFFP